MLCSLSTTIISEPFSSSPAQETSIPLKTLTPLSPPLISPGLHSPPFCFVAGQLDFGFNSMKDLSHFLYWWVLCFPYLRVEQSWWSPFLMLRAKRERNGRDTQSPLINQLPGVGRAPWACRYYYLCIFRELPDSPSNLRLRLPMQEIYRFWELGSQPTLGAKKP